MNLKSRKVVMGISCTILGIIFVGIFFLNFFCNHCGFKASLIASLIYTIPLAIIALPSGLLMMSSGDATLAFEDNEDSEDRRIFENKICPFYNSSKE